MTVLRSIGQVFCRLSLSLGFSDVFFSWLYWGCGKNTRGEGPFSSHQIRGSMSSPWRLIPGDVNMDHTGRWALPGPSTLKSLYVPFSCSILWNRVTKCNSHSRGGELSSISWREQYLRILFGILLYWRFVPPSLFVFWFIHSFIHKHLLNSK